MLNRPTPRETCRLLATTVSVVVAISAHAVVIPDVPLTVTSSAQPMVMLVASRDHRMFYEAYNDASDIDGDGTLDIRFKPSITYLGLFNPGLCYSHNGKSDASGLFTPIAAATGTARTCSSQWSGNWLNYVTTSRIDALRVVLYGGMREIDTSTQTVLRRAYIPQDAHSWAKEYTGIAADGYDISQYTPLSAPSTGRRHFFGNLTPNAGKNCGTLSACSDSLQPWLSVVTDSNKRVWEWAYKERPVLDGSHGGTRTDYTVRALACASGFTAGCKLYGSTYKPVGLLHEYGENDALLFGLITGSYDQSLSGGRLREVVRSFKNEVNTSDGTFTSTASIVTAFNSLRIRDFNNGRTDNAYTGGWLTTSAPSEGKFPDWGNPVGEMMFEAVRYFAGKSTATSAFTNAGATIDGQIGLPAAAWDDPFSSTSKAKAQTCSRSNMLVISDTNVSYDSDQLPGVNSAFGSGLSSDLSGLDVGAEARAITTNEPSIPGSHFIGQSGSNFDTAPSPKPVTDLGTIRGLAPEEPTKQGSYYAASVAYYAKRSDLRSSLTGTQSIDTFVVALASPLPRIEIPISAGRTITLVPFAKSVSGASISASKGRYQPTNQIVDFFVEALANTSTADADPSVNSGRYYAKFRINFEDVEQGADHDMDAIVSYTIELQADGTVKVTLKPEYQAGGIQHRMGYVISGTTADGVYLEVQDESDSTGYFLNTPPGRSPGYCDKSTMPSDCIRLPYLGATSPGNVAVRTFTFGTGAGATLLKDPLWYAAKWGGFIDRNGNNKPDIAGEWDADGDGVPDTYLLVQNPTKLVTALRRTLENIVARNSSASNIATNSTRATTNTRIYQATFNPKNWAGELRSVPATANGIGSTPEWLASEKMPTWSSRKLFVHSTIGTIKSLSAYSNFTSSEKTRLFGNSSGKFKYIKGERIKELQFGGSLRDRSSILGDIVDSTPTIDLELNAVFVGANDGMLHGFDLSTGTELFGFIPAAATPNLASLTSTGYSHHYFVDGEVAISARVSETNNQPLLVALMGRGGKGLFALNLARLRSSAGFTGSDFLWEYTPQGNATANADVDLGYMLGRPVMARLADGSYGVLVGNGYNSASGSAVLYVFSFKSDGSLSYVHKIDTGVGGDNGLSGPFAYDSNGDGRIDKVFSGDLHGNVWQFDLSSTSPASWKVGLGGSPVFQAKDRLGNLQPITAQMAGELNQNPDSSDPLKGKLMLYFGTGTFFRSGDLADLSEQSLYGVAAELAPVSGRSELKSRSFIDSGSFGGFQVRSMAKATAGDMVGKKGWFLDLKPTYAGERIFRSSAILRNACQATLLVPTMYPINADPCSPAGGGESLVLNPYNGGASSCSLDVNANNNFKDDVLASNPITSINLNQGIPSEPVALVLPGGNLMIVVGGSDGTLKTFQLQGATSFKGRISWREILRD